MSVTTGTQDAPMTGAIQRATGSARRTMRRFRSIARRGMVAPKQTAREQVAFEAARVAAADDGLPTAIRAGQSAGGLVAVMLTLTIAAAVGFVGIKVTSEIDSSITTTDGTKFDNASDSIAQGFADAMGLTDVVFLVLIAGVVFSALMGFRRMQ